MLRRANVEIAAKLRAEDESSRREHLRVALPIGFAAWLLRPQKLR